MGSPGSSLKLQWHIVMRPPGISGSHYKGTTWTVAGYHQYPFPSLLLIDLPALWQPSLTASRAAPHQYPRSPPPDLIHQSQRQAPQMQDHPSDPLPGTSKTLHIPSTDGACNKPTRNISRGRDTTTLSHVPLARHRPSKAQALAQRTPVHIRLA